MSEIYEGSPFNQPLVYERFKNGRGFFVPLNHDDLVVRIARPTHPEIDPEERRRALNVRAGLWREFGTYDGLNVPNFWLVAGNPTGAGGSFNGVPMEENLYIVTEWINGTSLDDIQALDDPQRAAKLEAMCCGLIHYFSDKYHNHGSFLSDQKLEQYVYGSTTKNPEPKVYWVDLDWEMGEFSNWLTMNSFIPDIWDMIQELEKKGATKFSVARTKLRLLLVASLSEDPYYSDRQKAILTQLETQ